jgi:hypothetical protein
MAAMPATSCVGWVGSAEQDFQSTEHIFKRWLKLQARQFFGAGQLDAAFFGRIFPSTMSDNKIYIEQRPQGDYAIRQADSERASAVAPTQEAAIEKAKKMFPGVKPHVERVRDTAQGSRDKWRGA